MEALNQLFSAIGRFFESLGRVIGMGVNPWRVILCAVPVIISAVIVANATNKYFQGEGGFRLGVDLSGGAVLVFEVDTSRTNSADAKIEDLAAVLKRRIDPNDLYNITIRPIPGDPPRVEIILPTGGRRQVEAEQKRWNDVLASVSELIPGKPHSYNAIRTNDFTTLAVKAVDNSASLEQSQRNKLIEDYIATSGMDATKADEYRKAVEKKATLDDVVVAKMIDRFENAGGGKSGQKRLTSDEVERIKAKISQQGQLEFCIIANINDDREAFEAAKRTLKLTSPESLDKLALQGFAPPPPRNTDGERDFTVSLRGEPFRHSYRWVEVGKQEVHDLMLNNARSQDTGVEGMNFQAAAAARDKKEAMEISIPGSTSGLLFSRKIPNLDRLSQKDRQEGRIYEYFLLVREPVQGEQVTGEFLTSVSKGIDDRGRLAVNFRFNGEGASRFGAVTGRNAPTASVSFKRNLAIILDQQIQSMPSLNGPISDNGQIMGEFTGPMVDRYVDVLRSGALPATLKPQPVSESTMAATLGEDTIRSGTVAIIASFGAVLAFMLIYYHVAGLVACIALFANLLLTVAFMVQVNAVFTLPGLAGLVLTLGMAVDANILIYERLREEKERGASLALALRNGYDRAMPTIIDTHLSSIFTAVILYIVGNDQLKGFGISLILGLLISLFTSLTMTRTLFDIYLRNFRAKDLSMLKVFTNPAIDFMSIRKLMFNITLVLTIIGAAVFLLRGKAGLNIDFNGGTAFTGLLSEKAFQEDQEVGSISWLRKKFEAKGETEHLPEVTVEQIFISDPTFSSGSRSRLFTVRTTEKETSKVKSVINHLFGPSLQRTKLLNSVARGAQFEIAFTETVLGTDLRPIVFAKLREAKLCALDADLVQKGVDEKEGKAKVWKFTLKEPVDRSALEAAVKTVAEPLQQKAKAKDKPTVTVGNPVSVDLTFDNPVSLDQVALQVRQSATEVAKKFPEAQGEMALKQARLDPLDEQTAGRFKKMRLELVEAVDAKLLEETFKEVQTTYATTPVPERLENFDSTLAQNTQQRAIYAIAASWLAIVIYLWFRFGNWTFGLAALLCLIHDLFFTLGIIALCHYLTEFVPPLASLFLVQDFKIDLPAVAALLTLVGYSVNDTIVVFDRIREVRGRNPALTDELINKSVNQTLSRTIWTSFTIFLVVGVLYVFGGEGVHLFAFIMVIGVLIGTFSSIFVASPLLIMLGEGRKGVEPTALAAVKPQRA